MYVCICQGVTDREIEEAMTRGARSLTQLQESLQVASCCGSCRETVESMLGAEGEARSGSCGACLDPA